jgi:hypothetical protein
MLGSIYVKLNVTPEKDLKVPVLIKWLYPLLNKQNGF